MNKRFNDKVALVTGAGRGLGASIIERFAQEGAHVIINDLNEENAKNTAKICESFGVKTFLSIGDISQYAIAQQLVEDAFKIFGRIDCLVNNAGIIKDSMLHKLTEDKWDDVIRINLKGPFNMSQAVAKKMMEQKYGKILNIASVAWLGNVGQTNYSASKAGLVGMTRTWALELAKYGINVNAIAPGLIETEMTKQIPEEVKEKFIQKIPLKKMGKPSDIAALVTFLCSDEANYITGQCLQIDGGLTVGISGI